MGRICHLDYLCMPGGYFWARTSENSVSAKFAEFIFYALGWIRARRKGASLLLSPGQMSLVTRLHTFLLPRLRNDAQLLHHLQIVGDAPVIPNLALRHSLHCHALDTKAPACGWDTKELAFVGTLKRVASRHLVAFGDHVFDEDL